MANAFKTETINFEPNEEAEDAEGILSLGKTYDKLPAAQLTPTKRKKEVKQSLPPWMIQPDENVELGTQTREKVVGSEASSSVSICHVSDKFHK